MPSKIRLFRSAPKPAVRKFAYTSPSDRTITSGGRGTCNPELDAVIASEVAARLCAGDDMVRAQGTAGIWERNATVILEWLKDVAEWRHDGTVEQSREAFL